MDNLLLKTAGKAARLLPRSFKQTLYRLGPFTRWLRSLLNRAAPEGFTDTRIAAGPAAGLLFRLDLQKEKDYWLGSYEPDLQDAVQRFIRPGMTVFDVGANIGYLSLVFARMVGDQGQVHAFEALPSNVDRLRGHAEGNDYADRLTVVHAAVVDAPGSVRFLVHDSHGMGKAAGSPGRDAAYHDQIEVDGISIDSYVYNSGHPAPDIVKMDIEGGEVLALRGMKRTLREIRPVVFLELHGDEAAEAAWLAFEEAGYTIYNMGAEAERIESCGALGWKAYIIALPEDLP